VYVVWLAFCPLTVPPLFYETDSNGILWFYFLFNFFIPSIPGLAILAQYCFKYKQHRELQRQKQYHELKQKQKLKQMEYYAQFFTIMKSLDTLHGKRTSKKNYNFSLSDLPSWSFIINVEIGWCIFVELLGLYIFFFSSLFSSTGQMLFYYFHFILQTSFPQQDLHRISVVFGQNSIGKQNLEFEENIKRSSKM